MLQCPLETIAGFLSIRFTFISLVFRIDRKFFFLIFPIRKPKI